MILETVILPNSFLSSLVYHAYIPYLAFVASFLYRPIRTQKCNVIANEMD